MCHRSSSVGFVRSLCCNIASFYIKYQRNETVAAKDNSDGTSNLPGLETCTIFCVVSTTAWSRSDWLPPQSWSTLVCLISFKRCSAQLLNLDYEKASSCPLTGTSSHKHVLIFGCFKSVKKVANLENSERDCTDCRLISETLDHWILGSGCVLLVIIPAGHEGILCWSKAWRPLNLFLATMGFLKCLWPIGTTVVWYRKIGR